MMAKATATAITPTTGTTEAGSASTACLLCSVDSFVCAFPVEHVVEVMRPLPIRRLDDLPPFVLGVALVRGAPTPVVDVARLLGAAAARDPRPNRIGRFVTVAAHGHGRPVALAVEEVRGIRALGRTELYALPPLLGAVDVRGARAIGAADGELLLILETSHLVPETVWSSLSRAGVEGGTPE
ncbi:MAG TPA: chemotaxis protein CheW [Polyangia bacterium]